MIIENINEEKYKTHIKKLMGNFPDSYKSEFGFINRIFVEKCSFHYNGTEQWINGEPNIPSLEYDDVSDVNNVINGKYLDNQYEFGDLQICFRFSNPDNKCLLQSMPDKDHCNPFWFEKLASFICKVNKTNPLTYKMWVTSTFLCSYGGLNNHNRGLLERYLNDFDSLRVLTNKLAKSHLSHYGNVTIEANNTDYHQRQNRDIQEFFKSIINENVPYNKNELVSSMEKTINDLQSVLNTIKKQSAI